LIPHLTEGYDADNSSYNVKELEKEISFGTNKDKVEGENSKEEWYDRYQKVPFNTTDYPRQTKPLCVDLPRDLLFALILPILFSLFSIKGVDDLFLI
jgi:hypothetical protein